jgi:hypothetical protein
MIVKIIIHNYNNNMYDNIIPSGHHQLSSQGAAAGRLEICFCAVLGKRIGTSMIRRNLLCRANWQRSLQIVFRWWCCQMYAPRQWGASLIPYLITSLITYIIHVIRKVITYSPRFISYSYLLHVITCNKFLMHYFLHVIPKVITCNNKVITYYVIRYVIRYVISMYLACNK